jgi:fructose-bisphosphate aldolase class I
MHHQGGLEATAQALSFSYGRALQAPSLRAWGGEDANVQAAQAALAHRARMNGLARDGRYAPDLEGRAA